jgi:hypothetical protein
MDKDAEETTETAELDELRAAAWIAEQTQLLAREEGFSS